MPTLTLTIPDGVESELKKFSWVNWSEVGREAFFAKMKMNEALGRLSELLKNSEMTEELAMQLGEELKERIYKRIKSKSK